ERHYDDRFCVDGRARTGDEHRRGDIYGLHAAISPHSDDDGGGYLWGAAAGVWDGDRVGAAAPAGHNDCGRLDHESDADAVHDAGGLPIPGSLAATDIGKASRYV